MTREEAALLLAQACAWWAPDMPPERAIAILDRLVELPLRRGPRRKDDVFAVTAFLVKELNIVFPNKGH